MKVALISLYLILTASIIYFIDEGIKTGNIDFYFGKDDGYVIRYLSIILLSTFFFAYIEAIAQSPIVRSLKNALLGFFVSIIFGFVLYFIIPISENSGIIFHILSTFVCYMSYFVLRRK